MGSRRADERAVMELLPVIEGLARRYACWYSPFEDLVSVGMLGALRAWGLWDGVRPWRTFAFRWVQGEMQHRRRSDLRLAPLAVLPEEDLGEPLPAALVVDPWGRAMRVVDEEAGVGRPARSEELTARELEVLRMVSLGATVKDAAERYGVSFRTVDAWMLSIHRKLGATGLRAISAAVRAGLLPCPFCEGG